MASFHIYYANVTYFPSPPAELSVIIFIIAKKKKKKRIQMKTDLQNYPPPWGKTNSPKCCFCLTELTSLARIFHSGVGGYNHRLVLTATELLRWEGWEVPDLKAPPWDGLQPIKAFMEQHQTVRLCSLPEVLLYCTRGLRFRSTTFPLFDLQFKCFTHVSNAFWVIFLIICLRIGHSPSF